jgi:hypothetical protein
MSACLALPFDALAWSPFLIVAALRHVCREAIRNDLVIVTGCFC